MQISLDNPELQQFVQEQVRTGRFRTAQEVVHGALSLLKAHEELSPNDLNKLRAEIAVGIEQADRGEVEPWDPMEIEAEVERRFNSEQKRG